MSKSLAIAYSMKKKGHASGGTVVSGDPEMNYAKGGEVAEGDKSGLVCADCGSHSLTFSGQQSDEHELDMVGKALKKRKMACGGKVMAHGGEVADKEANEFDYLETEAGEEALESEKHELAESEAEEKSEHEEGHEDDLVSKALSKRKAKKK